MTLVDDLENNASLQTGGKAGLAALMQAVERCGFRCYKKNHRILGSADFLASLLPVYVCARTLFRR